MATVIIRATSSSILRIIKPSDLKHVSFNFRCLTTNSNLRSPTIPRASKINKRISGSHLEPAENGRWSVISYNLSEELKIENAQRLLENFKEYQINDVPDDLQDEAVMLSLKANLDTPIVASCPLHDIFLFREGTIVFWGVPFDQQKRILYALSPLRIDPYSSELIQDEMEYINYSLESKLDRSRLNRDTVQLAIDRDISTLRLDQFSVSHAVALSVKLGIRESVLDKYIQSIGWVTDSMKKGDKIKLTREQVFRKTGEIYELKHHINLSSDLLDLPDIYWDRHDQEVLFLSLTSFLNIKKRTTVINEKLNNCCELMNLLAGHMNDKHHVRLEWMIIILIMVEVLFEFARII